VAASKATWRYYRDRKLSVTDVFRLLRPFWRKGKCGRGDNEKWIAIVTWLKERGLLRGGSLASQIWRKKIRQLEVSHPGKVDFERVLPVEDIEEWAHQKKAKILELRQDIIDSAEERGFLEADVDAPVVCPVSLAEFARPMFTIDAGDGGLTLNSKTKWELDDDLLDAHADPA